MNLKDYKVAKELKEQLSDLTSLVEITGFGSRARGDQEEYSDLDISIIVRSLNTELKKGFMKLSGR